jgi:hypothetical protein
MKRGFLHAETWVAVGLCVVVLATLNLSSETHTLEGYYRRTYGWPFPFLSEVDIDKKEWVVLSIEDDFSVLRGRDGCLVGVPSSPPARNALWNVLSWLAVLILLPLCVEIGLRIRAHRRVVGVPPPKP